MKAFTLLVVVALCIQSIHAADNLFGVTVKVTANTPTTLTYVDVAGLLPASLTIQTDADADVTLGLVLTPPKNLRSGIISAGFGFSLSVSPSTVNVISASLTTPDLTLNSNTDASVWFFDANADTYVNIPSVKTNNKIVATLPVNPRGTYIAVSFTTGQLIPETFNTAIDVVNGIRSKLSFPMNFTVDVTVSNSAELTVTFSETNPVGSEKGAEGRIALDAYFSLDLSGAEQQVDAILMYTYNKTKAAARKIKEETIRIGFFNTTKNAWEFLTSGNVDVSASVVSQTTAHFSDWAVYGEAETTPSEEGSSSTQLIASLAIVFASVVALVVA